MDMLPRHFPRVHLPKSAIQSEKTAIVIPQPTLPSVSLIFSNGINVKPVKPHQALHKDGDNKDDLMKNEAKSLKKQVRFKIECHEDHRCYNMGQRIPIERKVRSNLELTYFGSQQKDQPVWNNKLKAEDKCVRTTSSSSSNRFPFEINVREYERVLESESMKEKRFLQPSFMPRDNGNHICENMWSQEGTNVEVSPNGKIGERQNRSQSCDEILLDILEEQQHHIKIQQHQILLHEKQNLEQQEQIYILQRRIEQLLQNGADDKSQRNGQHFVVANEMNSRNMLNVYETNFVHDTCNVEELVGDNVKTFENEEMSLPNDVLGDSLHYGYSTDFLNHKISEFLSSKRHSDINITAQSFTYGTSDADSKLAIDRSLLFNLLESKYKCSESGVSLSSSQQSFCYNQSSSVKNNQISENVSSELYDYLKRHGLIK